MSMLRYSLAFTVVGALCVPSSVLSQHAKCEASLPGATTTCDWVDVDGRYQVRSIVTAPSGNRRDRLPAVLFVQWLSCDPVTVTPNVSDGWQDVLRALIQRSGMIVARTEKPGLDSSGGGPCEELGYDEEVAVHRAALRQLRRAPHVDPDSIFVFGGSMGGSIASELAAATDAAGIRGVIVAGTTAGTWLEHMLELDRRVLELRGLSADSVHALMPEHVRFQSAYLGERRTPSQIVADWSGGLAVWRRMIGTDTSLLHHYGRPIRYHHEAQAHNWPRAWAAVRVPVLVLHGEHDWIMSEDESRRILASLSPETRRRSTYVNVPRMGHDFLIYPSLPDSFRGQNGRFDGAVSDRILAWLAARRRR
jgi:pimeloyl-ACP methyl ester carboxylesterase